MSHIFSQVSSEVRSSCRVMVSIIALINLSSAVSSAKSLVLDCVRLNLCGEVVYVHKEQAGTQDRALRYS